MKKTTILKAGAAPIALGLALASSPVMAQTTTGPTDDETGTTTQGATIVVTGSRIARPNIEAASPVTVVGSEQVELTGTTTVENLLNELPQVIPGNTRVSNNSGGQAFSTLDLRGLGPGRTLILLDGERLSPSSTNGVVDVSQIPVGLIERVEVVTGGASAVYGSDAVAGVVNFILKDDFEGVELTAQAGVSEDGTGFSYAMNGLVGGNFADGRGNFTFYGSWTNRDSVSQARYPYSRVSAASAVPLDAGGNIIGVPYVVDSPADLTPGSAFVAGGGSATPPWGWIANSATNPFALAALPADNNPNCAPTGRDLSFSDTGALTRRYASGNCLIPLRDELGSSRYNFGPQNFLVTPYDRMTLTVKGNYEFSDDTNLNIYSSYSKINQVVNLAPTPATGIVVPVTAPFIPPALAAALASRPNPTAPFTLNRRFFETGPRIGTYSADAKQVRAVLEHNLSDDWAIDLVGSFSRIDDVTRAEGNIRASAVTQGLNNCPTGSPGNCVPINLFGPGTLTPAMLSFVALDTNDVSSFEQLRIATNLTGSLFELPGGPLGIAVGAEHRKDTAVQIVDDAKRTGDIIGFNALGNINGQVTVNEVYGEIRAPILPFLTVGAGARYSDYDTVGGLFNWKAEAEITPTDWVKIRGSYNRAARAPNVFELFRNGDQGFPPYTDPCNATNATRDVPFCIAQGVPAAAIPGFAQVNSQVQAFAFGNPNLTEEKAETWTAGIVLTPGYIFGANVSLTADWYDIKIDQPIVGLGSGTVLTQCYTNNDPTFCSRITRDPGTGQITAITTGVINADPGTTLEIAGLDVGVDVRFPAFGGEIYLSDVFSYTDKATFGTGPAASFNDTASPSIGGIQVRWANTLTAGWQSENVTAQVRYVWKKGPKQNAPGTFFDGLYPLLPNGNPDYEGFPDRIPDLHLVNASVRWSVSEAMDLTLIAENLLDKYPPQTTTGTFEQANTNIQFYDRYALGRTWTVQAKLRF